MKSLEKYKRLISCAQRRNSRNKLFEKHHLILKSLFSSKIAHETLSDIKIAKQDCDDNLVFLTLREHFTAHKLLVEIFRDVNKNCYHKMLFAFMFMCNRCKDISEIDYEKGKTEFRQMMSKRMLGQPSRAKGKKWSKEAKKRKSDLHYMRGKTYEDLYGPEEAKRLKNIRKDQRLGKKHSTETIEKLRKPKSKFHKKNLSKSKKGKLLSEESKKKIRAFMSNPDVNPHVDQTRFIFFNTINGIVEKCRKIDMKNKHKLTSSELSRIIKNKNRTSQKWKCIGKVKC